MTKNRFEAFTDAVIAIAITMIWSFGYLTSRSSTPSSPWISLAFYVAIALMWLVPDRRIETSITGT